MRKRQAVYKVSKIKFDKGLFFLTFFLLILGLIAIADASAPLASNFFSDSFYFVKQQLVWGIIGIIGLITASFINYNFWKKTATILFALNLILLILVLLPGIGSKLLGARRWLNFGPIVIQPSELVKLTLILYLAKLSDKNKSLIAFLIPLFLASGLIMLQPDLGTTIVVIGTAFVQIFIAGISFLPFLGIGLGGAFIGLILIFVSNYRRERLMSFLKIFSDPLNSSYHVKQILIALGSGGLLGVGLGQGRQKYLFLPETATDSVFAVIAEEIGFVGSLFIIGLLIFFIYRAVRIVLKAPDKFSFVLGSGIVSWITIQIFLNIASMIALVPLTGVPLPFFSYGGSSLTIILLGIGILLNISSHTKQNYERN